MQPAKILVADDEQNLRRVLAAMLRRDGHEVVQAASGARGDRSARRDVDVVITDLRMPRRRRHGGAAHRVEATTRTCRSS